MTVQGRDVDPPTPARGTFRSRWALLSPARKIVAISLLFVSLGVATLRTIQIVHVVHDAPNPKALGFHAVGSVAGTTYWVRVRDSDTFSLRTTGADERLCDYTGPDLDSAALATAFGSGAAALQTCNGGGLTEHVLVYLDRAGQGTAHLIAPDGTDITETGVVPLGRGLIGQRLDVFSYTGNLGDLTGVAPTFG